MLGLGIAIGLGVIVSILSIFLGDIHYVWGSLLGLLSLAISQVGLGFLLRKRLNVINLNIQSIMQEGQLQVQKKMNTFQMRPVGGQKTMQKVLEKVQFGFIEKALEATKDMEPFFKWSFLLKKQMASMRMQFYFQMRDFEKAKECASEALIMDNQSACIRMALEYKTKGDNLDKLFLKYSKKFKGENAELIYALYSWVLVKNKEIERAIEVLAEGKSKTISPIISDNWEALVNGKIRYFSNSRLGNPWYAFMLEEPKQDRMKQRQSKGQKMKRGQANRNF